MSNGTRVVATVVAVTALVITPLVLGGILLGELLARQTGAPPSVLPIAFSTVGFVAGMAIVFRIIKVVVARAARPPS